MQASLVRRGLRRVRRAFWRTPFERSYERWVADRGDEVRRHAYSLGPDPVVLDVGGYEGGWAARAIERFGGTLHVFEPVPQFAAAIRTRLADPRVHVHVFGLAGATREEAFHLAADGSSALRGGGAPARVRLRAAAEVFGELGLSRVDLMKINIEGGEYELLEHLLESRLVPRLANIQVQFHDFVPGAARRMHAIQQRLRATHELEWQYPFVWESWRRRSIAVGDDAPRVAP